MRHKRTAYYKYLKKHTAFEEFAELDEQGLAAWAVTYTEIKGAGFAGLAMRGTWLSEWA